MIDVRGQKMDWLPGEPEHANAVQKTPAVWPSRVKGKTADDHRLAGSFTASSHACRRIVAAGSYAERCDKEERMEIVNEALLRIRVEYLEMPDLKLTGPQARRLWNLSQEVCDAALAILVRSGFLWRTPDDQFLRRGRFEDS